MTTITHGVKILQEMRRRGSTVGHHVVKEQYHHRTYFIRRIMSGSYNGFIDEQRRDSSSRRDDSSYAVAVNSGRRSIGAISKDAIRSFQATIQKNVRAQNMMPVKSPVATIIQPPLQKIASEGGRIAASMQQSTIMDGVSGKLSSVNDRLGMMCRSASASTLSTTSRHSNRGIYSSQSVRSWGSTVLAEISYFTTQKVVSFFRRQNTCSTIGNIGSHSKIHNATEDNDSSVFWLKMVGKK